MPSDRRASREHGRRTRRSSYSRSRDSSPDEGKETRPGRSGQRASTHKRRRSSHSAEWFFGRAISTVLHDDSCGKCAQWLGHRIAARPSESYWRAREEEDECWEKIVRSRWRMRDESAESTSRERSPVSRSPTRSPPRPPSPQPRPPTPPQVAPRMETMTQELERKLKERDRRITYLENLAESMRRRMEEGGNTAPSNHLWSDRARRLPIAALHRDLEFYEARAARPEFGTPYDYSSDSDEFFSPQAAVQMAEISKRARRRAAMKKGNWVSRTVSQSSHEREPVGDTEKKKNKPLEERFEPWVAQPGPYNRDQHGGSSSSRADQWHSNVQGTASRPQPPQALAAGPPPLTARLEHTPSTTGPTPTGPAAMARTPTGAPIQVPGPTASVGAHLVVTHYLPERDEQARVIPLTQKVPGFYRLVYGVVIDLGMDFPVDPPHPGRRNPITGYPWQPAELAAYPRGLPGLPSDCPPSSFGETGQGGRGYIQRIAPHRDVARIMERSREDMAEFRIPGKMGAQPWRNPLTAAEVERMRAIARRPANAQAMNFYGCLVNEANRVPAERRNEAERAMTSVKGERALWAPFKIPKSRGQKERAREKRAARIGGTPVGGLPGNETPAPQATNTVAETQAPVEAMTVDQENTQTVGSPGEEQDGDTVMQEPTEGVQGNPHPDEDLDDEVELEY